MLLLLALVAAIGYLAWISSTVANDMRRGESRLVGAQQDLDEAVRQNNPLAAQRASTALAESRDDFTSARAKTQNDPGLRLLAALPAASSQVDATGRLAAIGTDLSRAGESAAGITSDVLRLKQAYAGKALTLQEVPALRAQVDALVARSQSASQSIAASLRAAHAERAQVKTTDLIPPLHSAYDQVDAALARADEAYVRYGNVRLMVSQALGIAISG